MSSKWILSRIALLAVGIAMGIAGNASTASAQGTALQRPIGDFLAAQGSGPPPPGFVASYISWLGRTGPKEDISRVMTLDYAGLDAAAVGLPLPNMQGSVTERPLANGQTNVRVTLRTSHELGTIHACLPPTMDNPCPTGGILFGLTPAEAAADPEQAAYGSSLFEIEYNVARAPGAPMEDLIALFFTGLPYDSLPLFVAFSGSADGELRAASGCAEGTAGRAWTVQTGLILAAIHNGFDGALADAFPAEWVEIKPTCN